MRIRNLMVSAAIPLAGCIAPAGGDGAETSSTENSALIGAGPGAAKVSAVTTLAMKGTQSETQVTVASFNGQQVLMATSNDENNTSGQIVFSGGHRTVSTGASLLGWSYSTDNAATWTYGGKLAPPPGWAVLWGDPAATAGVGQDANKVYISNLAVPNSQWPGQWIDSFDPPVGPSPLGGACIARSTDGGKTFSFPKNQPCVSNQGHFYDGASMTAGADGSVFAAYDDTDTNQIDVWMQPNGQSTFQLMPNPFPGITIGSHPRLRTYSSNESTFLYVAAQDTAGNIWMTYMPLDEGASWASPTFVVDRAAIGATVPLATKPLRTGPQFSFDVGPTVGVFDTVRLVYSYRTTSTLHGDIVVTVRDPNGASPLHLDIATCSIALTNCQTPAAGGPSPWGYPQVGGYLDQFHPNLKWGGGVWKMTFQSRENFADKDEIVLMSATLSGSYLTSRSLTGITALTKGQHPCPSVVPGMAYNYWGDYDGMAYVGLDPATKAPSFIRLITDSTALAIKGFPTCNQSVAWSANPQHVTSVRF